MLALEKQHILLLLASACAFRRITLLCSCLEAFRAGADTDAAWASLSPLPCRQTQDAVRPLQWGPYYPAAHVLLYFLLCCQSNAGPLHARKRGSWWLRILTGRLFGWNLSKTSDWCNSKFDAYSITSPHLQLVFWRILWEFGGGWPLPVS